MDNQWSAVQFAGSLLWTSWQTLIPKKPVSWQLESTQPLPLNYQVFTTFQEAIAKRGDASAAARMEECQKLEEIAKATVEEMHGAWREESTRDCEIYAEPCQPSPRSNREYSLSNGRYIVS
ncbi:uncharacterized protein UMAG_10328 [Mycosarcoma maydis]|uniref:Uncharacterized protein n=1 Tax=Mycosarcoma maydis TaxID=5270 RepID=A0A0D1C5N3_MYCMD|nr:uncharacterized protein UMAG_10328 [Ustilago maydis 521]KIS68962.1 hypothetical protein UMAG_10328 [Ustilago maydis 521]|eukprot:XP_011389485.1 hypothetical protein UMAG_10328 [Ustilago maydis 521]